MIARALVQVHIGCKLVALFCSYFFPSSILPFGAGLRIDRPKRQSCGGGSASPLHRSGRVSLGVSCSLLPRRCACDCLCARYPRYIFCPGSSRRATRMGGVISIMYKVPALQPIWLKVTIKWRGGEKIAARGASVSPGQLDRQIHRLSAVSSSNWAAQTAT